MAKTMSYTEAQTKFGILLDIAQVTPVVVQRHQRDCVAVISMEDYEQLQLLKNQKLAASVKALRDSAAERGLTEEILNDILREDA